MTNKMFLRADSGAITQGVLVLANAGLLALNILLFGLSTDLSECGQRLYRLIADFNRVVQPFVDGLL